MCCRLVHVLHRADYLPAHEEANDSGETDTSRGALAARYGDIVKRRVVSLDVEYRFESGWLDSGGVNGAASQHLGGRAV
jgi:hypothetical protein